MLDFAGFWASFHTAAVVTLVMLFVAVFDTAGVQYMCAAGAGLLGRDDILPGSKMAFFAAGASSAVGQCNSNN